MTTLIVWASWDQRRFAALHVASDSRISWGSAQRRWDAGRKVFASRATPDVWAYAGDVLFPALVLSQLVSAVDSGLLFPDGASAADRHAVAYDVMRASFRRRHDAVDRSFAILHASRDGERRAAEPRLWKTAFDQTSGDWTDEEVPIAEKTGLVAAMGSGKQALVQEALRWDESDIGGTSRAIYSAFCESISSGKDALSGGAPQLASIRPSGEARTAGALHDDQLYLHGLPIEAMENLARVEWFDSLFQRIDPKTKRVRKGAARHAKPNLR